MSSWGSECVDLPLVVLLCFNDLHTACVASAQLNTSPCKPAPIPVIMVCCGVCGIVLCSQPR